MSWCFSEALYKVAPKTWPKVKPANTRTLAGTIGHTNVYVPGKLEQLTSIEVTCTSATCAFKDCHSYACEWNCCL